MNELKLKEARFLHEAGKHQKAAKLYEELLIECPTSEEALYRLAMIYAEGGRYEDAVSLLQQLQNINQYDPRILLSLANVYSFMKLTTKSYYSLTQLVSQFPEYAPGYHNLGVYFYREQEWQQAIDAFKMAIMRKADYVDAYYHLALVCFKLKRFNEGKKYFTAVVQLDETHVGGRFHLGCINLANNDVDEALSLFISLHQEHPFHFETIVNISHCYLKKNDRNKAIEMLDKAHFLSPDDVDVLFNLGVLTFSLRQHDKAIGYYEALLNHQSENVSARYNLALVYLECQQYAAAKLNLERLVEYAPDFAEASYLLQALNGNETIKAAPTTYLTTLFDQYASYYDEHMKQLQCSVPEALYELYKMYVKHPVSMIIELGIGTGRLGELLCSETKQLIGVDVSSYMLSEAQLKKSYTALYQSEMVQYLQQHAVAQSADCIIAADSLLYIGDLSDLVHSLQTILKPGGYFIFNVEKAISGSYRLELTGRFSHTAAYLDDLLADSFNILHVEERVLRYQNQVPVYGLLVVCQFSDLNLILMNCKEK